MVFGAINFTIDPRLLSLADEYTAQVRAIVDDEALNLVNELQQKSPVGATKRLKEGWDFVPATRARNTLDIRFRIINNTNAAIFRVAGRRPGRMPPISALEPWVKVKLKISDEKRARSVAFLIARKIGREGTDRFNSGDNILGVDPNNPEKFLPGSPVLATRQRIIDRVNEIQVPGRRSGGRGRRR